jgi:outer membrane protein insertion porin family
MKEETELAVPEAAPLPRVNVVSVEFATGTEISPGLRERIAGSLGAYHPYDDAEHAWIQEMSEVGVRGALRDSGYFKAKSSAETRLVGEDEDSRRYAVTLHIEEGQQYRLGTIKLEPAGRDKHLAFSRSDLRKLVPLKQGDLFDVSKIREAMERITKLYASTGYIDQVPEPVTNVNTSEGVIDLLLRIDEGLQYRVGKVEFLGLDESAQRKLRPQLKSGAIYDRNQVEQLLKNNRSVLPPDASWKDVSERRNTRERTVDLRFDFYTCPKFRN